jgi:predicted amidohydrolase
MTKQRRSPKALVAATAAMTPDLDSDSSRGRMQQIIEETKRENPDVRLILFGETILGWFYKKGETREYHEAIAETAPGTTTQFIGELAKTHNLYISFGFTEKAEGKLFNSQVLLSPKGEILAKHRKFRIRNKIFTAGPRTLTIAQIDGIDVAIVICADVRSLWLRRQIRRARVDVVLASLADYETNHRLFHLMGVLYDAWVLVANRYSEEPPLTWHGLVTITDPWARLCHSGIGKERVLVHRLRVSNSTGIGRLIRRMLVGFKTVGLVTALTTQMVWTAVAKRPKS